MMMQSNFPGKLIVVEGLDGSGKSTQLYLLQKWLKSQSVNVYFTEWNSSVLVKSATSKGKKRRLLTPTTFSLIHATDFSDRYDRHIVPLLKAGYIVLADRYVFTAYVRDIVRACHPDWVRQLYRFAIQPDITFYFKVDTSTAVQRIIMNRRKLKYFEAGMDLNLSADPIDSFKLYQAKIAAAYDGLSNQYDFVEMDAAKPIHEQQQLMRSIVSDHIDLDVFRKGGPHA